MKKSNEMVDKRDEYIYNNENGHYVWYNSFIEAFSHLDLSKILDSDRKG